MIFELFIFLCVLLIILVVINRYDYTSPAIVFCVSFVFSCFWAVLYQDNWDLDLHSNTFWVILGGTLEFAFFACIVKFCNFIICKKKSACDLDLISDGIAKWKLMFAVLFCVITLLYTLYSIVNVAGGSIFNIGDAIYSYRIMNMFSSKPVTLPSLCGKMIVASTAMGYWCMYVLINDIIVNKKFNFYLGTIIILTVAINITTGGRGGAVNIILSAIAILLILIRKKTLHAKANFKLILTIVIIAIIFLFSFKSLGQLIGREISSSTFDYLALYCGAEIKNLDMYLQERIDDSSESNIFGALTFFVPIRWLIEHNILDIDYYIFDLPFRVINGYNLGNVYTTFYAFIYDFGYTGVIVLVAIMAIISQYIYNKCMNQKLNKKPSIYILIYSYIFNSLLLSFFSNKFYEQNLNITFLYYIIYWYLFNYFFMTFRIRKADGSIYITIKDKNNDMI